MVIVAMAGRTMALPDQCPDQTGIEVVLSDLKLSDIDMQYNVAVNDVDHFTRLETEYSISSFDLTATGGVDVAETGYVVDINVLTYSNNHSLYQIGTLNYPDVITPDIYSMAVQDYYIPPKKNILSHVHISSLQAEVYVASIGFTSKNQC